MKNAIILHGKPDRDEYYDPAMPSMSNAHWIPWLQGQLLKKDIQAVTPEVPFAFEPDWELWCREVERFDIGPETMIVGHSCGGGFWLRWLSEHKEVKVGKVVLVAPSLGLSWEDGAEKFFQNFELDADFASRTDGLTIFYSDNDEEGISKAISKIKAEVPGIKFKEFHLGHFTIEDMKTPEFPELLEELTSKNY